MKKTLSRCLSVLMLLTMLTGVLSLGVSAKDATKFYVNSKSAIVGETVTVSFGVDVVKGFCAGDFVLTYDDSVLTYVSHKQVTDTGSVAIYAGNSGVIKIAMASLREYNKSTIIYDITFKVNSETQLKSTQIAVAVQVLEDINGKAVSYATQNSTITISKEVEEKTLEITSDALTEDGTVYKKVGFFALYINHPVQLDFETNIENIKTVKWTSDNTKITIDENGLCTAKAYIFRVSGNVTLTVTTETGEEFSQTFLVKFYRFNSQKYK